MEKEAWTLDSYEAIKTYVFAASDLDNLAMRLNCIVELRREDEENSVAFGNADSFLGSNDVCDLPTFGGDEPSDTQGVFSWDSLYYLAYNSELKTWDVRPRHELDEE